jgi:hypothetical protein
MSDMNRIMLLARLHSHIPEKHIIIVSLLNDSTALVPIFYCSDVLEENLKTLTKDDMVGIVAHFDKSSSDFCRVYADKISLLANRKENSNE